MPLFYNFFYKYFIKEKKYCWNKKYIQNKIIKKQPKSSIMKEKKEKKKNNITLV